jgi:CDP-diacylglycerol--glycerol-3-phosphate 3-phosphatidyltransferase
VAAAAAIATGHFGIGAALAWTAAAGDALDGLVARRTGTTSAAGALFDASVDRYQEFCVTGALALAFRERPAVLVLSLGALVGSFMVSYGSAKAEALRIVPPRGVMRRAERAVVLGAGLLFGPIASAVAPALGLSARAAGALADAPIVAALAIVAFAANASAIRRLARVAAAADRGRPEPAVAPAARAVTSPESTTASAAE